MNQSIEKIEQTYKILKILSKLSQLQVPDVYKHHTENIRKEAESLLKELHQTTNVDHPKPLKKLYYFQASLSINTKLTSSDQKEALESEKSKLIDCVVEGPFRKSINYYVLLLIATDVNFISNGNRLVFEKISKSVYDHIKQNDTDSDTNQRFFKITLNQQTSNQLESKMLLENWMNQKVKVFGCLGDFYGPALSNEANCESYYYLIFKFNQTDNCSVTTSVLMDHDVLCSAISPDHPLVQRFV